MNTILFDLRPLPKDKDGVPYGYYPVVADQNRTNVNSMLQQIEKQSTISSADMKAMFDALSNYLAEYLAKGYRVDVPGVGTFSAQLVSDVPIKKKNDPQTARHLSIGGIAFKPKKELIGKLWDVDFHRTNRPHRTLGYLSDEVAMARIRDVLAASDRPMLTRNDFVRVTGYTRTRAANHLTRLVEQGLLVQGGSQHERLYWLAQREQAED